MYEMTRRWVAAGHQVTVITAPYEKSDIKATGFISKYQIEGVSIIVINAGDSNRLPVISRAFRAFIFASVATFYALTVSYQVVIASSGPITIGIPMILAKLIRRKKTVFEVRDLWPAGGIEMGLIKNGWQATIALWFEKLCYKKANLVVTASVGQQAHIKKRFPKLRTAVIPNASDLDLFGKHCSDVLPAWTQDKYLFTHIGSLGLIHNIHYWMKVAQALKRLDEAANIYMIFIGDGADRQSLEAFKKEQQLDNIHFLGLKPKNELPVWVQHSVATLFATLDNPVQDTCSPNKIFDSFAAGVPIVQTSNGWIRDLVAQENCGINVSLKDPDTAAKELIALTHNTQQVQLMGQNARHLAQTTFNRDKLAADYLALITSL